MYNLEPNAARLEKEYIALGGKRLSKIDDNISSSRKWDKESQEATAF